MEGKFVAYYRVSTARQGRSGLGLEAQKAAVMDYLNGGGWQFVAAYTEVESGGSNVRPQLLAAIERAKLTGSKLLIAKLDRLSRNAAFLLTLRDSGVEFVCADMPQANLLTIGVLAVVAQHEREQISARTREALKAAKARGVRLGNPNGAAALRRAGKGNGPGLAAWKAKTAQRDESLRAIVMPLHEQGASLADIASYLNEQGIQTPRSKTWYKSSIKNLLGRLCAHQSPSQQS